MISIARFRALLFLCFFGALAFLGGSTPQDLTLVYPIQGLDSLSYDHGKVFLLSLAKERDTMVTASTQWEKTRYFDFRVPDTRDNFAKDFLKLFSPGTTIGKLSYAFKTLNRFSPLDSAEFLYTDSMTIRKFWDHAEFSRMMKKVKDGKAERMSVTVRGWSDSVYVTPYDDPLADSRALYKVNARLVPGLNTVYFAPNGRRSDALAYTTTLQTEQASLDSRASRFHAAELEKQCVPCHEGLPSADEGQTMQADCSTCHKALAGGSHLHAPVEMKECGSCHEWSAESKIMAAGAVPDKCFECHTEKKEEVENAASPHPVATECTTCHSPHSSDEPRMLRMNVYDLCTSCHPSYKLNHPVGGHPMRFVEVGENGEQISCISCHNPHGSASEKLLKVEGGKMAICTTCHE